MKETNTYKRETIFILSIYLEKERERKTQTDTMFRHTPSEACKEKRERVCVRERRSVSLGV